MSAGPGLGVPQRIGVFGGAFDPPHQGHVALAQAALDQLQLDELRIIPTGLAGHKTRSLTASEHRLAMARLAFAGLDRVVVDPRETLRTGVSYTVDTLRELRAEFAQAQLFLIIGQDQAAALHTWHQWQEIPRLAIICVAARADFAGAGGQNAAENANAVPITLLHMPPVALSATTIRQKLARHENVETLVFAPVARYIASHHLYQTV